MTIIPISKSTACLAYVRVSTEKQAGEKLTSLADQQTAIHALAERMGVTVQQFYRDEGASGATVDGRPAFRALLHHCEANPRNQRSPGYVLFLNDSRFGRFPDPDEAAALRFRFRAAGWLVRFCESDDTEDVSMRSLMRSLGSVQASEYRRQLQRNTRRGHRGAAQQGFWTRKEPYGYRRMVVYPSGSERVLEPGQHKTDLEKVRLTPYPPEAEIVRWIFEQYASGTPSMRMIADELRQRSPDRDWQHNAVGKILKNPVYRGALSFGNRPAPNIHDKAPAAFVQEGTHPAIVSAELWHEVQRRISNSMTRPRRANTFYMLSGLVVCTCCGERYVGGGTGPHRDRTKVTRFYRCAGSKKGICDGKFGTIAQSKLEGSVIGELSRMFNMPRVRRQIAAAVDRALSGAVESAGESEASVRNAREEARAAQAEADRAGRRRIGNAGRCSTPA